jgi:hypothetical protein
MSKEHTLLSRDAFREAVFARDNHKCVFCDKPAVDAHHIVERRLFSAEHEKGGYFINNGASVCEQHHIECEQTTISVEDVRIACGILKPIIPDHLYEDPMDKWGNPILASGLRLRGELFWDESVQKILAQGKVLDLFTNRVKFPRTHHVPWSEGICMMMTVCTNPWKISWVRASSSVRKWMVKIRLCTTIISMREALMVARIRLAIG